MRIVFLLLFCLSLNFQAQQKNAGILKSTINTVGSSSVRFALNNNKEYKIQQSIGQSSIIGKKNVRKISVQQGFLTNNKVFHINNSETDLIDTTLDILISPNPFIDHIKINFSKATANDIQINIYDLNGKVLLSKKHKPTDLVFVPMRYFGLGSYIIHIQSGNNKFTKKLLKTKLK
jgi:hypothetical protein